MCSCGKMTASLPPANSVVRGTAGASVQFEYVGRTSLTAIGPITGQRYRFGTPGARVAVDLRDRQSLLSIPHLRQIRS